ncbi:hypothetical protein B0H11DRAFT_2223333 [Mycena galericulata]|nr:hypothetical protein B0H11DRAFT_2223333 [Mycena galericulata]
MTILPCDPVFQPSPGDEDSLRHSNTNGCWFYVVGNGHVNGIYTDSEIARRQVNRFSNAAWKKASTWNEAVKLWREFCRRYHRHTPLPVFDLSPTPSPEAASAHALPPPSPSPSPPPPPYEALGSHAGTSRPTTSTPDRQSRETSAQAGPTHRPASAVTPARTPGSPRAALTLRAAPPTVASTTASSTSSPSTSRASGPRAPDSSPLAPTTASTSRSHTRPRRLIQVTQVHSSAVTWQEGDRLYGIEGVPCLFETRYNAVDYVFENNLREVGFLETRNRRRLVAFISRRPYVRQEGDPENTE